MYTVELIYDDGTVAKFERDTWLGVDNTINAIWATPYWAEIKIKPPETPNE